MYRNKLLNSIALLRMCLNPNSGSYTAPMIATPTLVQKLDDEITKLTQVRDLLADAGVLAVINHVIGCTHASNLAAPESFGPAANGGKGRLLKAARECVRTLDAPFTKMELAAKMRGIGCVVNATKTQLQYPVQRLLSEGVVKIVEEGGGRRPTRYQTEEPTNGDATRVTEVPMQSPPQLRDSGVT